MPKHYVAIPTVSTLGIMPHVRLIRALQNWKITPDFVDNFMPQWQARAEIVRRFLASDREFLTMIDYDTVPWMLPFHRIAEDELSNAIWCGYYALYTEQGMFQWSVGKSVYHELTPQVIKFTTAIPKGMSEWDVCGFGCVTMPRSIVFDLASAGCFDGPPPVGVTEDAPVCQRARAKGIPIRTHHDLYCEHWRTVDISFQLRIQNELLDHKEEKCSLPSK